MRKSFEKNRRPSWAYIHIIYIHMIHIHLKLRVDKRRIPEIYITSDTCTQGNKAKKKDESQWCFGKGEKV